MFRRRPPVSRWILRCGLLAIAGWLAGFVWFASTVRQEPAAMSPAGRSPAGRSPAGRSPTVAVPAVPPLTVQNAAPRQAIVVLTGGSGRLSAGLALLAAGLGEKMFVSGVYRGVNVAALLRLGQQEPEDLACCISLGYEAGNTRGNARETAIWMRQEGFDSLILVTANYHMRRSLLEFRREMPWAGIQPHPISPVNVDLSAWWRDAGVAWLLFSEYSKWTVSAILSRLPRISGA